MGEAEPRSWRQSDLIPSPYQLRQSQKLVQNVFLPGEVDAAYQRE